MVSIVAGAASSPGRVRALNEDSFYLGASVFAVADGMGGHAAGERASALAVQHIARVGIPHAPMTTEELVARIKTASDAIAAEAATHQTRRGMGTTLVGMCLTELGGFPHWLIFNVGDSRLYIYDRDELTQLTVDHSEVQELIDSGEITVGEAEHHPHRHVITRSMGSDPGPRVDTWLLPADTPSTYLLCSDGLTTELDEGQIRTLLASSTSPQMAADRLVEAAEAAGGRDNITVLVVESAPQPSRLDEVATDTVPRAGVSP